MNEDRQSRRLWRQPEASDCRIWVDGPAFRLNPTAHLVHRACVERGYSYANYEPSTRQFRLIALGGNPIVVHSFADSRAIQSGTHVIQPHEIPVFLLYRCLPGADRVCVRGLQVGERVGANRSPAYISRR
jgi:hypothetical protein